MGIDSHTTSVEIGRFVANPIRDILALLLQILHEYSVQFLAAFLI